jgi:hypothetical protein
MIINLFVAPLITAGGFMIAEVARLRKQSETTVRIVYN